MFESWSDDDASEIEPQNYWDSPQRFDDDEAMSVDEDVRLDRLSEVNNEN